ncbi:MAG: endonuclease/exonuclease/phosphatase family protein [Actinomycetota bacterium]
MHVVTWNLWWQFGPWQARQPAIGAELARLDPDITLLQEVWFEDGVDQAAELARPLGLHVARTTDRAGDPQRFGNAILSRWPIRSTAMIRLSGEDGEPSHRSALAAVVETPDGLQPVVVTHLAWQYNAGPLRVRQLEETVRFAVAQAAAVTDDGRPTDAVDDGAAKTGGTRSSDGAGLPIILGGDFNAVPDSDEIRRLTGLAAPYVPDVVFTDCWAAVGDGDGHTWTRANPHSADALWPRRRLDYVFVAWPRPKPLRNPVAAFLAGTEPVEYGDGPPGGIVPSDHYAVVVQLDDRQTL